MNISTSILSTVLNGTTTVPCLNSEVMNSLSDFATTMNVSSAEIKLGGGVSGVIVKETDPRDLQRVSLAYVTPDASPNVGA